MQKETETVDIKKLYENRVLKIWQDHKDDDIFKEPDKEYRKHPLLPKEVIKNSLMFIGINPSFTKNGVIPEHEKNIGFYSTLNKDQKDITYFEKMKEIAKYCKIEWTHLDLFFLRETNQKIIEGLTYSNIKFLNSQLDISFEIIEKSSPKLLIVSNALASEFFGKKKSTKHRSFKEKIWKGYDLYFENNFWNKEATFNVEIGAYEIKLNNKLVPVLFSGMLSGQRALDIGSLERLKWQSRMILEGKKMV